MLSEDQKNVIALEILSDFQGYASYFLKLKNSLLKGPHRLIIDFDGERVFYTLDFENIQDHDIVVSFQIPQTIKHKHDWIELDTLSSSTNKDIAKHFIMFIKRYGVKIRSLEAVD